MRRSIAASAGPRSWPSSTPPRPPAPAPQDDEGDEDEDEDDRRRRRRRSRRKRAEDDLEDGAAKVKAPAICLIVGSAIGLVWRVADLAYMFWNGGGGLPAPAGPNPGFQQGAMWGALAAGGLALVFTPLAIAGAVQMLRLRNYQLAKAAAIVSLVPCTGCCLLNLPFGIWALIVLSDPVVKRAFEIAAWDQDE